MLRKQFIVLFLFLPILGFSQDEELTPELVVGLKSAGSVELSPNGERIVYHVREPRSIDEEPGPARFSIWLLDRSTGEKRRLSEAGISSRSPQWSPDGSYIAFLSQRREHHSQTQIYVLPTYGGEAYQLTSSPTGIRDFTWSPDGTKIAYTAIEPLTDEQQDARDRGFTQRVIDQEDRFHRLHVIDVDTKESELLNEENLAVWDFEWSPDGSQFIVQASDRPDVDYMFMFTSMYFLPATGGEMEKFIETEGKLGTMAWSPDGSRIAYMGATALNDPTDGSIFIASVDDRETQNITEGYEGTVTWLAWLDDESILFTSEERQHTVARSIPADGGEMTPILMDGPNFSSFSYSRENDIIATAASTHEHPNEVYSGTIETGVMERHTDTNPELADIWLGEYDVVKWEAEDGWIIEGLLLKPKEYREGERYPLLAQIHGGPEAAYTDGWNTTYNRWGHILAQRGVMVFFPNYRASTGRGVEFAMANHRDLAGQEFQDVLDGIDYLIDEGLVDPERVGIGGASYGGYFSAWGATRYSDRFAVAVTFAGASNRISSAGTTDAVHEFSLVHWDLRIYDHFDLVFDRSPIAHIHNADTPVLIGHGENDRRVDPGQAWELYRALQYAGVETEFVLYPGAGHGLTTVQHQLDFLNRSLRWFDRYLLRNDI